MTSTTVQKNRPTRAGLVAAGLLAATLAASPAHADEAAELQRLRATTLALIDALVQQGLLTRERADALLRQAEAAPVAAAPAPKPTTPPQWGDAKSTPGVVRVPYIPETLKREITNQIRGEVLATANEEGWADPRALPDWLKGVTISGDFRLRAQRDDYDEPHYAPDAAGLCDIAGGNLPAACYRTQAGTPAWSPDLTNTTEDRSRLTLRARLGVDAKISDDTRMALRLSTGSASSGPTSSSTTLGNGFNKAGIALDRAWLQWEPRYDLRLIAGRMPNPFFGSDLLWPDDLGFDGLAVQGESTLRSGLYAFGTAGAFPLQEFSTGHRDHWLYALQAGVDWSFTGSTALRVALGVFDFARVEGVRETEPAPTGALAGTTDYFSSQYPSALRLKGNTLIALNDPTSTAAPVWGLASKFRPVNLSARLTMQLDPVHQATLHADWVRNLGFDLADIRQRAGTDAVDGLAERTTGLQLKFAVSMTSLLGWGDWQVYGSWRRFERDAWIDGFTDTTWFGGGGTNYQGWQLGGSYSFDRRTAIGLRATSTRNLSDGEANLSSAPLKVETLQVDLSTRF